ncbi:hypothetical protein [Geodermatophilus sp. URMC 63]
MEYFCAVTEPLLRRLRSILSALIPRSAASSRLRDLAVLERGWLDGSGEPVAPVALEMAGDVLRRIARRGWRPPGVFPLIEGGVQLEWGPTALTPNVEALSVEIRNDATTHVFLVTYVNEEGAEFDLGASDPDRVAIQLGDYLR